jgi:ABC-type nitrate/sulfonate/bicarbonate transport system substrate-binding protein
MSKENLIKIGLGMALAISAFVSPAPAQESKFTLVYATPPAPYLAAFYVAEDKGFYKEAGLAMEYKTVAGDQNGMRALVTGSGNVTIVGAPILYEAVLNGGKVKGIGGGNQTLTDYYLIMGKGKGTTLKDAAGKTLAISNPGSMPQLLPQMMFTKQNIDSSSTKYLPIGGFSARLQAVLAGKVDGSLVDIITALRAEKTGEAVIVADAQEIIAEPLGYTFTIASEEGLSDPTKRKALYNFVKASMRGARYVVDHPEEAAASILSRVKETPIDLLTQTVQRLNAEKAWGVNGGVNKKIHDFTMQTYLQFKLISKEVSYKDAFDDSLVVQARKELGDKVGWQ